MGLKISEMTLASAVTQDDLLTIIQDGTNKKAFISSLSELTSAVDITTSATCYVSLFESSTGLIRSKTSSGLTYNALTSTLTTTNLTVTNLTANLPITSITGLGSGIETFLATPTSSNLLSAVTDEVGSGNLVFNTSPGFNTAINPVLSDGASLGTSLLPWSDLFLALGAVVNFNNDILLTHSADTLTITGGTLFISGTATNLLITKNTSNDDTPVISVQNSSGNGSFEFYGRGNIAQIYYSSNTTTASIIQTLSHESSATPGDGFGLYHSYIFLKSSTTSSQSASSTLTSWATAAHATRKARVTHNVFDTAEREAFRIEALGSSASVYVATNISPLSNGSAALGTTSLSWSNLFVASGAVINFNNGNATITHSNNLFTFQTSSNTIMTIDSENVNVTNSLGVGIASVTTTWLKIAAATTAKSAINLPTGSAPSSPIDGDIWREDNTNTGLKIRINGITKTITVS